MKWTNQFISDEVKYWVDELNTISTICSSQPHAALTHGMLSKWSYISRTTPCIGQYLEKLYNIMQYYLISNLTGRPPLNETDRELFALAARLSALGIAIFSQHCDTEFMSSMLVTAPLTDLINSQDPAYPYEALTN